MLKSLIMAMSYTALTSHHIIYKGGYMLTLKRKDTLYIFF